MERPKFDIHQLTAVVEALIGMPVFIILAKDKAAVPTIADYMVQSQLKGGTNLIRTERKKTEIENWQKENPGRVKAAD